MENYADLLFIDEVLTLQERDGSADRYKQAYGQRTQNKLTEPDRAFIADRESFYISSVSSTGWPYVQHRGGPKGFLKVIGDNQLGFIDYPGNRQFITMGHTTSDNRVALFLMDYERRARLKLLGRMSMQRTEDVDPELVQQLSVPDQARAERVAIIDVVALDWNCPKYIPQMLGMDAINGYVEKKLRQLEQENKELKGELAKLKDDFHRSDD